MEDHLKSLSLVEEEDGSITYVVDSNEDGVGDMAVGRFLTDRAIRVHIMKERMAEIWRPVKESLSRRWKMGCFCSISVIIWMAACSQWWSVVL